MANAGPTSGFLKSLFGNTEEGSSSNKKGLLGKILRQVMMQQAPSSGVGKVWNPGGTAKPTGIGATYDPNWKPPLRSRPMPQQIGMQIPQTPFGSLPPLTEEDIQRMILSQQGMQ